jgi:hypothetical protein
MTDFLWKAPGSETVMCSTSNTDLDSLADDDLTNLTTVLDNTSNRHTHASFELKMGSAVDMSAGNDTPIARLYLLPSYDGTNYVDVADLTNETCNAAYLVGVLGFQKKASQTYAILTDIPLGPWKYKGVIYNDTGVAFAADNSTFKAKTYCIADA